MPEKPKPRDPEKHGSAKADDETKAMIYEGLNLMQICRLFGMDHKTVVQKLYDANVKPIRKEGNSIIYSFLEVAPYLIKPIFDIETYIKRMNHTDLPKHVTKEFWAGLRSKQDYEEKAGLLWSTAKVVEEVGEIFKIVKMSTLLMLDGVERNTELSDRQKGIIRGLASGMLNDLMVRISKRFVVPEDGKLQEETDNQGL